MFSQQPVCVIWSWDSLIAFIVSVTFWSVWGCFFGVFFSHIITNTRVLWYYMEQTLWPTQHLPCPLCVKTLANLWSSLVLRWVQESQQGGWWVFSVCDPKYWCACLCQSVSVCAVHVCCLCVHVCVHIFVCVCVCVMSVSACVCVCIGRRGMGACVYLSLIIFKAGINRYRCGGFCFYFVVVVVFCLFVCLLKHAFLHTKLWKPVKDLIHKTASCLRTVTLFTGYSSVPVSVSVNPSRSMALLSWPLFLIAQSGLLH